MTPSDEELDIINRSLLTVIIVEISSPRIVVYLSKPVYLLSLVTNFNIYLTLSNPHFFFYYNNLFYRSYQFVLNLPQHFQDFIYVFYVCFLFYKLRNL